MLNGAPRWELYRLLSDPTRLRVLALCSLEELAVSELGELLRASEPKVSRHAAALRDAGVLAGRKQGTWLLLRLAPEAQDDAVVADALGAGLALVNAEGSADRVSEVVGERDRDTRDFFARGGRPLRSGPPEELAAYLRALAPLVFPRQLAIDAGTGDGALLELLAPLYEQVIALDRSAAQLDLAKARARRRQFKNVRFVCGAIDGPEVRRALGDAAGRAEGKSGDGGRAARRRRPADAGADAVFAARVLHHAPAPARALSALARLARPAGDGGGGAVVILDYEAHRDEAMRHQEADLWLGFESAELIRLAEQAGLCEIEHGRVPKPWRGDGPDSHVGWQWLVGRRAA
jgi:ArsR family transcriptional regulator